MRLRNVIALVAMFGLATEAYGAEVLRRTDAAAVVTPAATPAVTAVESQSIQTKAVEVKAIETKAVETKAVETKTSEPVVSPVETKAATKADELRKARVSEEVHTESKIVEKLEGERLSEEQKRADRLFSDKKPESTEAVVPVAPIAPTPSVTIQKVEIIQPALIHAEAPPVAPTPALPPKAEVAPGAVAVAEPTVANSQYKVYVGAIVEAPQYNDSRVSTNYGLGATLGVLINEDYAVEGSFIYSNYNIGSNQNSNMYGYSTFGNVGRQELDQYEVKATFKWYAFRTLLGESRLKPFIGASAAYIYREYSRSNSGNQAYYGSNYGTNSNSNNTSDAFNVGALVGTDFAITPNFAIGAFFEYSTPVMTKSNNTNNFDNSNYYNTGYNNGMNNNNRTRVDTWDVMTIGLTAKFTF